jgi:hypothetical protein
MTGRGKKKDKITHQIKKKRRDAILLVSPPVFIQTAFNLIDVIWV